MPFLVRWEIDSDDAKTPLEAVEEAFTAIQDPDTIATVFTVVDKETGKKYTVDLKFADARALVQEEGKPPVYQNL